MNSAELAQLARNDRRFLDTILAVVPKDKGDYAPFPGVFTITQQIRHIAQTINWFREGVFERPFDMDFEKLGAELATPATIDEAFAELNQAWDTYIARIEASTTEELLGNPAPNEFFGQMPRWQILLGNSDHTAHHRGALGVYLRGLGITPPMPYS